MYMLGVAGDGLVHGVVEDFGEQVVQGPLVGAADIHARPLADRLQAFQHLDVEKVKSSIWGFFKDNSVKIVLHRDRDCMFHMLNQLYGVQFRDVRLRTKRYSQREVFYRAVVQIGALIASADGMAESRELLRLKHFFGLSSDEFPESAQLYNLQLEAPQSVEQILQEFRECFSEADQLKETFLFGMAEVAMSDGVADPAEIELLWRLARYLEIEEHIVVQILESAGIRTGKRGDAGTSNFAGTLSRSRCCAILGVDIDATGEQIRFAYREMVRRYHPDVLRSQQLPEEELERAGILIRRINEAYEFLKDSS
jgi:DnaJ like chaperone protein